MTFAELWHYYRAIIITTEFKLISTLDDSVNVDDACVWIWSYRQISYFETVCLCFPYWYMYIKQVSIERSWSKQKHSGSNDFYNEISGLFLQRKREIYVDLKCQVLNFQH